MLPTEEPKPQTWNKPVEEFKSNMYSSLDAYMDGEVQKEKDFLKKFDARKNYYNWPQKIFSF